MELFAWLTEMDIYQLDRVSESHQRKFLALIGIHTYPPSPATALISVGLEPNSPTYLLPESLEFEGDDPHMQTTRFRSLEAVTVAPGKLQNVQIKDRFGLRDLTEHWLRGDAFGIFGQDPRPGAEFHLGFSEPLPLNETINLYFSFTNPKAQESERRRLLDEIYDRERVCFENEECVCDADNVLPVREHDTLTRASMPGTRLAPTNVAVAWDVLVRESGEEKWRRLSPQRGEIQDDTSSFTFNGAVRFRLPVEMAQATSDGLYHLRCRFVSGDYDSPPVVRGIVLNGFLTEQSVPVGATTLSIAKGVVAAGDAPANAKPAELDFRFNSEGEISELSFVSDKTHPEFFILEYREASDELPGSLRIEAVDVGVGTGWQKQKFALPKPPVQTSSLKLFTLEDDGWRTWHLRDDLDSSKPGSTDFLLDPTLGFVGFGDGENGHVPPMGARIFAAYRTTRAEEGNLGSFQVKRLAKSPHNEALIDRAPDIRDALKEISNPYAATNGAAAEELARAKGRAVELMDSATRAITVKDYELLAMETPGVDLARVGVRTNLHPAFPCLNAPGMITVMILPDSTTERPSPSAAMRDAVSSFLGRRRPIGTSIKVVGPRYIEVTVKASVFSTSGVDKARLQREIIFGLDEFFHPLRGGADGRGWPFGRDVFRTEVMQVIHRSNGTDHVSELEIYVDGGYPQCGNVCLPANGLIASGPHQIEIF
jgi:hypothetical protein